MGSKCCAPPKLSTGENKDVRYKETEKNILIPLNIKTKK